MFRLTRWQAKQALARTGSPNGSRSKGFEPKTLIEKNKAGGGNRTRIISLEG